MTNHIFSEPESKIRERFQGCLIGLAVGDALGAPVEFLKRGEFEPVTDMQSGGAFNLPKGYWTDDTSLALCLAYSLLEKKGFDARDQLTKYLDWYENGYMSSVGYCFDIGGTTRSALADFKKSPDLLQAFGQSEHCAGNGSIMRLAPVPMFYLNDRYKAVDYAMQSSQTTHNVQTCMGGCALLSSVLWHLLTGHHRIESLICSREAVGGIDFLKMSFGHFFDKPRSEIKGNGYVVDSLEAALWCFMHTNSYADAVLEAVNLGDDSDTTAAITGQLAGAFYGINGIPETWKRQLYDYEHLISVANSLFDEGYEDK